MMGSVASAFEVLGTGTGSLIGNDLTDLGDDGDPENDDGYDAIFDANDEPGFGGGEFAFNVFDNRLGPSNDKWCCGKGGGIAEDDPIWVSATLPVPHTLTSFTVSSANDVPNRDPIHWSVQGSNDGQNFTDIYTYDEEFAPWDERLQVIHFTAGDDFPVQTQTYDTFRLATFNTLNNPNGAYFQIGEIEYFGDPDPNVEVPPIFVGGENTIGTREYEGDQSNEMFGPEQSGVPGWTGRIVTADEHGLQLDTHELAEEALEDNDGTTAIGAYPVVDMGGGGGTFPDTQPYPNGVADTSQSDFAVEVTAEAVIPVGTWTVGIGSDDGGRVKIPGVEFTDSLNDDMFDEDEIRFNGNRGHGWTVGTFEVSGEPLETTITGSFHERGGGDSFEIAVIDDELIEAADPNNGWELLGDGTFGWSVTTTTRPLLSADLSAEVRSTRAWRFDVNGDDGSSDQMVVTNPDPDVFNTILNVEGVTFNILSTGSVESGEAFTIIDANEIVGTPIITSATAGQNWVFDANTGQVCLDTCPGVLGGDYDGNGVVDAADADAQSAAMKTPDQNLGTFDENGDGTVNFEDRLVWIKTHAGTWVGDSNLDNEFNSGDLVFVFTASKYETNEMAGWSEGDWDGDMLFDSTDFVAAFTDGGYEQGPAAMAAAVPEPSSFVLALVAVLGLAGVIRRR